MTQDTQEQSFSDGFALGELTGRLKHSAPVQLREWVPLSRLQDIKKVLQKYHYSLTGLHSDPADPSQVLVIADKHAAGSHSKLMQMYARDQRFMDGWEAGFLSSLLRYAQPPRVEQWAQVRNLTALQQVIDEHHYVIVSLRVHDEDERWVMLTAHPTA